MISSRCERQLTLPSAWVVNTALTELDPEVAKQKANGPKVRKDLKLAFELSADRMPLKHYKDLLVKFEQDLAAELEKQAAAAATPKKSKKKAKGGDDEDVEMADPDASVKSKTKKRKAEDGADVSFQVLWYSKQFLISICRPLSDPTPSRSQRSSLTRTRHQRPPTVRRRTRPRPSPRPRRPPLKRLFPKRPPRRPSSADR